MKVAGKVFEARARGADLPDSHVGERLRDIRKRAGLTQADLAGRLGIGQGALSRLERRSDILVSTLRDYIQALGGTLRVDAYFDDPSALIGHFAEADYAFDPVDENQFLFPIMEEATFPARRDVVFSIKPEYAEKIVLGEKTVELRRRFPVAVPAGTVAMIYTTSPTMALTGMAEIGSVTKLAKELIWENFSDQACIRRDDFDKYFSGIDAGYVISLNRARRLKRALELKELRERFGFEPPQSYLYASPVMREALKYECSHISH